MESFRTCLEGEGAPRETLRRAVEALSVSTGCWAAVTERSSRAILDIVAEACPDEFGESPSREFIASAADRIARRSTPLPYNGAAADASRLPDGKSYLGIPVPRRVGARLALHICAPTALSPATRRLARAAADCLGAWAAHSRPRHSPDLQPGPDSEANPEYMLSDALRAAAHTVGADTCSLMVTHQPDGELVVDAAYGLDEDVTDPSSAPAGQGIASYVMAAGQPVILGDPLQDPRLEGLDIAPRRDIRSSMCVPIVLPEGLRGVANFNRTEVAEPFAHADLQLGCAVAAQLGRCVAAARRGQSPRDPAAAAEARQALRRTLDELHRLGEAVQRIAVSHEPVGMVEQLTRGVMLLTGCAGAALAPVDLPPEHLRASGATTVVELSAEAAQAAREASAPWAGTAAEAPPPLAVAVRELERRAGGAEMVVIPCSDSMGVVGLVVGWGVSRAPTDRELLLAGGLCGHSAGALRRAIEQQSSISQRSLELSALYQLCGEISAATTFESALRSVLEIARSMVQYDEGLIFIHSEETSQLELAACRGAEFDAVRAQAPQDAPGNLYQWVFAEGKAFISTDVGQHRREDHRPGQLLLSSMAVPLVVGNETIGVLAMHSALPHAYTEQQVKVLSIVASQAAAIYRALQSLGRLSRYTDKILQSIVAGVIGLDRAGKVVMWSPAAAQLFGCDALAAMGKDFLRLAHELGRNHGGRAMESLGLVARRVLAHGEPVLEHDLRVERDGAPPRTLLADCTPLRDGDGHLAGAVLLVEDVTERNRMQERMRQMSQLAAVGHLAANVAHEIRNPLSAIKTAAQFLSTEYDRDSLAARFSDIINQECDRLNKVATDFLTYARPNEPQLELIYLSQVIDSALAATAREVAERNLRVNWRRRRSGRVWADADAMRQVFVNLIINAAQAVREGGEITIALRTVRGEADGAMEEVTVSDDGPGISQDDAERIWAPFFSTKAKGTGLGLSIVRKTVEAHGGQVWAESPRGGGAVFRLRLPMAGRGRGRPRAAAVAAEPQPRLRLLQLSLYDDYPPRSVAADSPMRAADKGDHE